MANFWDNDPIIGRVEPATDASASNPFAHLKTESRVPAPDGSDLAVFRNWVDRYSALARLRLELGPIEGNA